MFKECKIMINRRGENMKPESLIDVYLPVNKETNLPIQNNMFFISKNKIDADADYYCFDADRMQLSHIDNLIRYLITHQIHSLSKMPENQKQVFLSKLDALLLKSNNPILIEEYKKLTHTERMIK